jgi:protein-S-isoprenylcysteine O-methyltransferase Ste14
MLHFPKPYADTVARLRVPGGFLLVACFGWFAAPSRASLLIGLPVAVVGLLLRAWAAGHLAKNSRLATSGPYTHLRNPLYVGTLLVAAGLVVAARNWIPAAVFGVVFLGIYLPVIELEEQHLRKLFPEYADYARRVPALLPRLGGEGGGARFQWALYRKNQEYQALAGFVLGAAYLVWRSLA